LPKPFYPAGIPGYPQTVNRFTLLWLTTDDGVQGLAAGVAFERDPKEVAGLLEVPLHLLLDPAAHSWRCSRGCALRGANILEVAL